MNPAEDHSDQQLRNVIANRRKNAKLHAPNYLAAMEELARARLPNDLQGRSRETLPIVQGGRRRGSDWSKVRYAVNTHLGDLIDYAHGKGWPLLSAIVVNQQNVATGGMEPTTLKGFIEAARALGYTVVDEKEFLREQQSVYWPRGL